MKLRKSSSLRGDRHDREREDSTPLGSSRPPKSGIQRDQPISRLTEKAPRQRMDRESGCFELPVVNCPQTG